MFSKKYNQAHVDRITAQTDKALARIEELEAVIRTHKNLEFELKVVKQLLNDDEAVLELLEGAKKKKKLATAEEIMLLQMARPYQICSTNNLRSASALQALDGLCSQHAAAQRQQAGIEQYAGLSRPSGIRRGYGYLDARDAQLMAMGL